MGADSQSARERTIEAQRRFLRWLLEDACPLWATRGVDRALGGFQELLNGSEPVVAPRRVRVQPRQIAAFAQASRLGWGGDVVDIVRHGLDYLRARYRREDGLYRALVAADGAVLDDRALLYDQAFVLLGLAESQKAFGAHAGAHAGALEAGVASAAGVANAAGAADAAGRLALSGARSQAADDARALCALLYCCFKREGPGFESAMEAPLPALSSNAHMHLLEASLACFEADGDTEWLALADEVGELALSRFIDPATGAVREHFGRTWEPLPGLQGRLLEPGHHFEWAWLFMRWGGERRADAREAAFRLIDVAERHGVHNRVAINAMLDDFSIHDGSARLWPQTERIKAAALAARITGDERYWTIAAAAADALWRYLQPPIRGSWYDRMLPDGRLVEEPAPASSFYHLVGAIAELTAATAGPQSPLT